MKNNSWIIGQGLRWALWRIRKPISVCLTLVLMMWVLAPAMSAASNISKADHKAKKDKKDDSKRHKENKHGKKDKKQDKKSSEENGKKKDDKKDKKSGGKHDDDKDDEKKDDEKKDKKGDKHKKDKKDDAESGDDGGDDDKGDSGSDDGGDSGHGGDDKDRNDGHGNDEGNDGEGDAGGDDGNSDDGDDDEGGKDDPGDDKNGDKGDDEEDDIPLETSSTPAPEHESDDYESAPPSNNKTYSVHIDKWDAVDPVAKDGTAQYYIRVYNNGKNKLTNVKLTDSLPDSFRFISSSSGRSSWNLGSLPAGTTKTVWLVAKPGEVGKSFENRATVTAKEIKGGVSDSAYTDVVDKGTTAAATAYDLAVSKTDNVDSVRVGNKVTYTITVKNQGTKALTGLTFKDWMPSGITYQSSTTTVNRLSSGVYTWTTSKLDAGESRSYEVVTNAAKHGVWTNTVSVKANEIPADKLATAKTRIIGEYEIIASAAANGKATGGPGKAKRISGKSQALTPSTPIAGFPISLWWIVTFVLLSTGLIMEIRSRLNRAVIE